MCAQKDEKLQIVAFSTNDSSQTPNDIINIFLGQQNHKILKKSKMAIAFSTQLKGKETRIMICSVLNLSKEYTGITDVNCYLLFIDLEKSDSIDRLKSIINYAKDNCRLSKKIFVLGMVSGNEDEVVKFTKADVTQILDEFQAKYEYKEINLSKIKEISDIMEGIFEYSSHHPIDEEEEIDKEDGQARSCILF
jgi:hypothetical protein